MPNDPNSSGSQADPFATNPYAPTLNVAEPELVVPDEVEVYRRKYLSHEASIKSIGTLYMLGALFLIPIGIGQTVSGLANGNPAFLSSDEAITGLCLLSIGVLQGFVAFGLRRLQSWARVATAAISVLGVIGGLIGGLIGALISGYILYLVLCKKGQVVFSKEYKRIVEQTPHIQYRTSIIIWIFVGLLLVLVFLGLGATLFVV